MIDCIHEFYSDQSGDVSCMKCRQTFSVEEAEIEELHIEIAQLEAQVEELRPEITKLRKACAKYRKRMEAMLESLNDVMRVHSFWDFSAYAEYFDSEGKAIPVEDVEVEDDS